MVRLAPLFVLVVACGSTAGPSAPDAGDASAEAAADGAPDLSPDQGPDAVASVTCAAGTACNQRLEAARCPGSCVPVGGGLACHGQVLHGLCFNQPPPTYPESATGGTFRLAVRERPAEAVVGDTLAIAFDVTNTGPASEAAVGIKPGERFTLLDTGDFDPSTRLALAAGQTRTITAHVRAEAATALNPAAWPALDVTLAGTELEQRGLRVPVAVGFAAGSRSCGGRKFPDFNLTPAENYGNAACCEGVFFPGAQCCASSDCQAGSACVDGICAVAAPHIQYSGSPLLGPQRVLVVFVDEPEPKPRAALADLCADQATRRGADLGLGEIEAWFADTARRRVGRPLTSFRFTVLGGLKTADLTLANNQPPTYGAAVEAFLRARGCTGPWADDFDRVVVVAPRVETGEHQGLVYAADRVAVQLWSSSIITHELAHTFGATDRYFDVGGTLQYGGLLMSTVAGPPASLGDGVFWGEAGLGDLDGDGIIDALAFSRAPERLELMELAVGANPRPVSIRSPAVRRPGIHPPRRPLMRFVITARPSDPTKPQSDTPPSDDLIAAYMKFNEEMHNAGVLVAAEGLTPGAPGARIGVFGGKRKVLDGPFTESKELVGGFYVIDVATLEEAKAWALRCPTGLGSDDILEIRQLTGSEDVPAEMVELTKKVAPNWSATWIKK